MKQIFTINKPHIIMKNLNINNILIAVLFAC